LETSRHEQTVSIGLDGCLRAFTKEEQLGEEELYYCSKCNKHRLAAKKLQLWRLPPILVIMLTSLSSIIDFMLFIVYDASN